MGEQFLLGPNGAVKVNQCPVCGGFTACAEYFRKLHIYCMDCGLSGLLYKRLDDAVMEWNRLIPVDKKQGLQ